MTDRYGNTCMATVLRDWNALRDAIRAHDTEATEAAFEKVERWAGLWTTGQAFTADDLCRAFAIAIEMAAEQMRAWANGVAASDYPQAAKVVPTLVDTTIKVFANMPPPDDLPARVKEGRDA